MKLVLGILIGLLIATALVGAFYLGSKQKKEAANLVTGQTTITPITSIAPSPTVKPVPTFPPITDPNIKRFISQDLGITFTYKINDSGQNVTASQNGNKVYVYLTSWQPEKGQYVQIFQKDPGQTLDQAVNSTILKGYSTQDCILENYNQGKYPPGFQAKIMTVPRGPNDGLPELSAKAEKCPQGYVAIGGLAFFLYDPNHPDRFAFFSIGQYAIDSENGQTWQDTLKFF